MLPKWKIKENDTLVIEEQLAALLQERNRLRSEVGIYKGAEKWLLKRRKVREMKRLLRSPTALKEWLNQNIAYMIQVEELEGVLAKEKAERLRWKEEEENIDTIIDMANYLLENGRSRYGKYEDIGEEWKGTFYDTHRKIAEIYGFWNFDKCIFYHFRKGFTYPLYKGFLGTAFSFTVHCDMVIGTINGFRLKLSDPYGTIITEEITSTSIPISEARRWVGRMIVAGLQLDDKCEKFTLCDVKLFRFTKYEDLRASTQEDIFEGEKLVIKKRPEPIVEKQVVHI